MNRRAFTAGLLAVPPLALGTDVLAASRSAATSNDAAIAARMISQYRQASGLPAVAVDARMNAAAQQQARAIASIGQLSHGDFANRVRSFGIRGSAAENLAYGSDTVAGAIAQWQNSGPHRANLLLPSATRIGLGRADGSTRYWALVIG